MLFFTSWHGYTPVKPWYLSTARILRCVQACNKASVYWSNTWCGFLLVLWFDHRHAHARTHAATHTHADTHTHTQAHTRTKLIQVSWPWLCITSPGAPPCLLSLAPFCMLSPKPQQQSTYPETRASQSTYPVSNTQSISIMTRVFNPMMIT